MHHTLYSWFEATAARHPEKIALCDPGKQLTYAQLNERANQVAHALRKRGVGPESLVALWTDRCMETIIGILGILKAGGAYLPLDAQYPVERTRSIIEDAAVKLVLSVRGVDVGGAAANREVLWLDDVAAFSAEPRQNPEVAVSDASMAYVIYTSGSTGKPKGVVLEHRQVLRLFTQTEAWYGFGPSDVFTLFHSHSFDWSVWEIFAALLYGARLVIVPHAISRSFDDFHRLLIDEKVTVLGQTPTAFRHLLEADGRSPSSDALSLRYIIFGGERLDFSMLEPWFARHGDAVTLVNMYGITETTVHSTFRIVRSDEVGEPSLIGVPIPDLRLHLLDAQQNPTPPGEIGEIFIEGPGVARGYYNRPELTQQRFIENPFGRPGRLYKSGDLARYRGEELEYIGRADLQVQLRGFRVELGEIEAALMRLGQVRSASVVVRDENTADPKLVAFIVLNDGQRIDPGEVRRNLRQVLPPYMVPNRVYTIAEQPLTPMGKLDRQALQRLAAQGGPEAAPSISAAQERALAHIAAQEMEVPNVNPDDDIFDLGATSLTVTSIVERARKELKLEIPVQVLLEQPKLAAVFRALQRPSGESSAPRAIAAESETPPSADEPAALPLATLARQLSVLRGRDLDGRIRYLYASAGGKYATQLYVELRQQGVLGLAAGLYYYDPQTHALLAASAQATIDISAHHPADRRAVAQAPFCLYFVADLELLRPTYKGFADSFAYLDAGYLEQLLRSSGAPLGLFYRRARAFDGERLPLAEPARYMLTNGLIASLHEVPQEDADPAPQASESQTAHFRSPPSFVTKESLDAAYRALQAQGLGASESAELDKAAAGRKRPRFQGAPLALPDFVTDEASYRARFCHRQYDGGPVEREQLLAILEQASGPHLPLFESEALGIYVYCRPGRMQGLAGGLYRYHHAPRSLTAVGNIESDVLKRCHAPFNRKHFEASSFSIFFLAHVKELEAVRGPSVVSQLLLESGLCAQRFMQHQSKVQLGLVPIGGFGFEGLRQALGLSTGWLLLHGMAGGTVSAVASPQPQPPASLAAGPAAASAIAIVGMSGRYPKAQNPQEFWQRLREGERCIVAAKDARAELAPADATKERWGAFIDAVSEFDSSFFNLAQAEAETTEPEIRLMLQTVYEALEDAATSPSQLRQQGLTVGVFIGCMYEHYRLLAEPALQELMSLQSYSGIVNRLSFHFDFHGPSIAVDAACASSAIAIHLGALSLAANECDVAIVGGVNLTLHAAKYAGLESLGLLGSHPERAAFSHSDGMIPGEGSGVLVLKRQARAEQDQDRIYGLVRGSATNHNGRTRGFNLPSSEAQVRVMQKALQRAAVLPEQISYVESSATGSPIGDPVELAALGRVFGGPSNRQAPCALGSIKGNIGHLEAAAGLSQVTKVLLQLQHRELAPSLGSEPANPSIDFAGTPFRLQKERAPWSSPRDAAGREQPRLALVNSFAAGGSNACLVLEAYEPPARPAQPVSCRVGLPLSARTAEALRLQASRLADALEREPSLKLQDAACTLARRELHAQRLFVIATNKQEAAARLRDFAERGETGPDVYVASGASSPRESSGLVRLLGGSAEVRDLFAGWLHSYKLDRLAVLWSSGIELDLAALARAAGGQVVSLPTYPFAKQIHWLAAKEKSSLPMSEKFPATVKETQPEKLPQHDEAFDWARRSVAAVLRVGKDDLGLESGLAEVGLSSLIALRLCRRIESEIGIRLQAPDLLKHGSVGRLLEELTRLIRQHQSLGEHKDSDAGDDKLMRLLLALNRGELSPSAALSL